MRKKCKFNLHRTLLVSTMIYGWKTRKGSKILRKTDKKQCLLMRDVWKKITDDWKSVIILCLLFKSSYCHNLFVQTHTTLNRLKMAEGRAAAYCESKKYEGGKKENSTWSGKSAEGCRRVYANDAWWLSFKTHLKLISTPLYAQDAQEWEEISYTQFFHCCVVESRN